MAEELVEVFDPPVRLGKIMDWVEREMTEWAEGVISDYGWDIEELTEEQCDALEVFIDDNDGYADIAMMGMRNVLNFNRDRIYEEEYNNDNA